MITVEELKMFEQTEAKLSKICQEWAKQNLDNRWQHYVGWALASRGYIDINYWYNDIVNNIEYETCYGASVVSWEDMVEFSKTLEL